MMQRILYIICLLVGMAFSLHAQDNVIDEVLWIIGDDAIMKSDIENQRIRMAAEGTELSGDPYCKIPELLAINKLFLNQADIDSVYANENSVVSEVNQRLNYFIAQIGSKEKVEEYFGKKINDLKEELKDLVRDQMRVQQVQSSLMSDVTVTPSEVREYYNELPKDSLPSIPVQVEIQIITIQPQISLAEKERVKNQLRDYKRRIENGSDFSVLALLYSEDKLSAEQGGELGLMPKNQLVKEFANAAVALPDTKAVSGVVETEFGYHIIQLIEKQGDMINARHILLTPKLAYSEKKSALARLDSVADLIRSEKITFEEAVPTYSDNKETLRNKGQMVNLRTGTFKFEYEQLPTEIAKVAYTMKIGEISEPFIYVNEKGKEVAAIVRLKDRHKAHVANLNEDYQLIKSAVSDMKKEKLMQNWIQEKQKTTYIKIDERWQNCDFTYDGWVK